MTPSRESVAEVLQAVVGVPVPLDSDTLREQLPAWDSVKHIEFVFALEDAFEVVIPEDAVARMKSVDEAVAIVEGLRAA